MPVTFDAAADGLDRPAAQSSKTVYSTPITITPPIINAAHYHHTAIKMSIVPSSTGPRNNPWGSLRPMPDPRGRRLIWNLAVHAKNVGHLKDWLSLRTAFEGRHNTPEQFRELAYVVQQLVEKGQDFLEYLEPYTLTPDGTPLDIKPKVASVSATHE